MNVAICLENVSFSYEELPILEKVSLQISKGEFIGIFGPNGGGKTTLLKLLLGFLQPDKGSINILGKSPEEARLECAYVPQSLRCDRQFPISVLEIVMMGCLSKSFWWGGLPRSAKEKALHAIAQVGLTGKERQPFGTLSGGEAQRALIARALVSDPKILLLDEPTASVDPEAEQTIHGILQKLKGQITLLMVTHDLSTILDKVNRCLCIQREVSSYAPTEVCEHFALGLYHPRMKL